MSIPTWSFPIIRKVRFTKIVTIEAETFDDALDKLDSLIQEEVNTKQPISLNEWHIELDTIISQM